ncbi:MAG: hypothetical protein IJS07_00195 [Bacteroidales bacterium]|nr:hypothetical protein [Bacteroidales bacterium]
MKKLLFITLCAALAFTACEQSELGAPDTLDGTKITFKATQEGAATRTELSGSNVNWSVGDQIKIIASGADVTSDALTTGGATATFNVTVPDEKQPFNAAYAVYPAGTTASYDGSSFTVTLPAAQTGRDSFGAAAIEVSEVSGEGDLAFKHLGAVLKITVASDYVRKIKISSYGNKAIAGVATVTFTDGIPSVASIASPETTITVEANGAGDYFATIFPADLEEGFYVELLDGSDAVLGQRLTGKSISIARRDLASLGTVAASPVLFVTPKGSGSGASWDTPMGWSTFKSQLASGFSGTAVLAGGTYNGDETSFGTNSTVTILGGFNPASTGTDLSDRDIVSYETIFDGAKSKRLFVWNNTGLNTSFDGITFQNAYFNSSNAGAALIIQSCVTAKFNNCTIKDNKKEGSSGGGAIRANKGDISFTNCTFDRNKAYGSGGVMLVTAANLVLDNCVFSKDSTSNGMGSAIYVGGETTLYINKCHFNACVAQNNIGTIAIYSEKCKSYLNSCSFYGNKTRQGGSCIDSKGLCGVYNSSFQLNQNATATEAANIYSRGGNCIVANSSIRLSANSAAGVWSDVGQVSIVNSTFINSNSSSDETKTLALKTTEPLNSYGHNIYSKLYETVGNTYRLENPGHEDVCYNLTSQGWDNELRCHTWDGVCPVGFVKATPARVEKALDDFDSATGTGFKAWLTSLRFEGGNALQTDIRGHKRSTTELWPGSYEN